ncbi:MAG TPA: MFS transporter [Steroidobacteraceae bacterium]|jgi:ACS family glucarate transporter-like MFS transporter
MTREQNSGALGRGHVRYLMVFMLFAATTVNYADRASLSIVGPAMQAQLHIAPITLGYIFSAFGWAYAIAQLPGGWLLDRFGSRVIYAGSILLWSLFTLLQGAAGLLAGALAVAALFALRLLVGLAEAPAFPGNSRIVAAWFPGGERATAAAIFNSGQYFATVMFAPVMAWLTHRFGWPSVFVFLGGAGLLLFVAWLMTVYAPSQHSRVGRAELDYIAAGGGLIDMDQGRGAPQSVSWQHLKVLLSRRMLIGIYIGQYCVNVLTYFFLTWFPVYLVEQRGMSILKAGVVIVLPAICGFAGGVLGGIMSDALLRRGVSLSLARKIPIVGGLLLSTSMILCNFVQANWIVVLIMSLAFFGKGVGSLGWAVVADTAPKEMTGLYGGLFNTFGNVGAITTPIVIGYIVAVTGSFSGALVYVGANALLAVLGYTVIAGRFERVHLTESVARPRQPSRMETRT